MASPIKIKRTRTVGIIPPNTNDFGRGGETRSGQEHCMEEIMYPRW